jgi:hypothetical protein
MAVNYIILGDFDICTECGHYGASHDGGILAPMQCHANIGTEEAPQDCPCVLDAPQFQVLVAD